MKQIIFFFIITALFPLFAHAKSYDFYVDKSYGGEEDGSSDKPFAKIDDAIEKAGKGDEIYIKNGEYKGSITLKSGVSLYGQDKNKTILSGGIGGIVITAPNDNSITNLTISGGSSGILFQGSGEITNCVIKNATKKGIDLSEENKEVIIKKNTIKSNGKGIYAQKGREIDISDNDISGNREEGLDIREKVQGKISDNSIIGNGEGGIEFIVGSSDLSIIGNDIKKNKASGLAAQFYTQAKKIGQVKISKNTVSSNGDYGLTCKAPSGGNYPKSYWNDSLDLTDNKIENNKSKAIAGSCKLIEAVSEDELKNNQAIESENSAENQAALLELEAQKEAERIAREEKLKQMESERQAILEKENYLKNSTEELEKENTLKIFFIGYNQEKISRLKQESQSLNDQAQSLHDTFEQELEENDRNSLLEFVQENQQKSEAYNSTLQEKENKPSLFGWLIKLWQ